MSLIYAFDHLAILFLELLLLIFKPDREGDRVHSGLLFFFLILLLPILGGGWLVQIRPDDIWRVRLAFFYVVLGITLLLVQPRLRLEVII